jgi:ADP-heptose:LPS heptosyltransferase
MSEAMPVISASYSPAAEAAEARKHTSKAMKAVFTPATRRRHAAVWDSAFFNKFIRTSTKHGVVFLFAESPNAGHREKAILATIARPTH